MARKIGALVIHGMGSQGRRKPADSAVPSYSKKMQKRVAQELGTDFERVAWREVFWSHVLQERQEAYLKSIKRRTDFDDLRKFVMCNLSDAASYRKTGDQADNTYELIHREVAQTLAELRADLGDGGPILIVAHSLGGHIMSNYIYDAQVHAARHGQPPSTAAIENMETVCGLITFGCNIPVFLFSYPADEIRPIDYPGDKLPDKMKFRTWWYNFYDRDDILGYPLADIGPKYRKLADDKHLLDHSVNAGDILTSWNPLSHNAYWKDAEVYEPVARFLRNMLRALA